MSRVFVFSNLVLYQLFFSIKIVADHFSSIIRPKSTDKSDLKKKESCIYELYDKTLLSIGNVHKITKLSQFQVDMHSWIGGGFITVCAVTTNLVSKDVQDFKEKFSNETARQDLLALRTYRTKHLGPPPPPPAFLGLRADNGSWLSFLITLSPESKPIDFDLWRCYYKKWCFIQKFVTEVKIKWRHFIKWWYENYGEPIHKMWITSETSH